MKEIYTKPEVEVEEYNAVDVLTNSTTGSDQFGGEDDD